MTAQWTLQTGNVLYGRSQIPSYLYLISSSFMLRLNYIVGIILRSFLFGFALTPARASRAVVFFLIARASPMRQRVLENLHTEVRNHADLVSCSIRLLIGHGRADPFILAIVIVEKSTPSGLHCRDDKLRGFSCWFAEQQPLRGQVISYSMKLVHPLLERLVLESPYTGRRPIGPRILSRQESRELHSFGDCPRSHYGFPFSTGLKVSGNPATDRAFQAHISVRPDM